MPVGLPADQYHEREEEKPEHPANSPLHIRIHTMSEHGFRQSVKGRVRVVVGQF